MENQQNQSPEGGQWDKLKQQLSELPPVAIIGGFIWILIILTALLFAIFDDESPEIGQKTPAPSPTYTYITISDEQMEQITPRPTVALVGPTVTARAATRDAEEDLFQRAATGDPNAIATIKARPTGFPPMPTLINPVR